MSIFILLNILIKLYLMLLNFIKHILRTLFIGRLKCLKTAKFLKSVLGLKMR